jgi:ribose 5-phosphate isomerase B
LYEKIQTEKKDSCIIGMMKIFLGADHGGYRLKEEVKILLQDMGYFCEDLGTNSQESVDYPQYGKAVAEKVVNDPDSFGIVICGSGIGISIAANKVSGARAALCTTSTHARLSRQHNNANILALGERMTGIEVAKDIVKTFLATDFEGGRHENRVCQIENCCTK